MADAKSRYEQLAGDVRNQFLQRARHNALLTIPSLMPLEGSSGTSHLIEPYQGLGARAVTHLASRLTMALLPAGRPYMRLDLNPAEQMKSKGSVDPDVEKGLALSEQLVQTEVENAGWRTTTLQSLLQLIVAGNILEFKHPDNTIRLFRLDQFVIRRDHGGRILELIIQEKFSRDAMPPGVLPSDFDASVTDLKTKDNEVELYTHVEIVQERGVSFYRVVQSVSDRVLPKTAQTFKLDELPYLPLRWASTPGEDYGRAKVEEHIGDLRSLEALEKAMLEMAAMASRNFIMVRPSATGGGLKSRLTKAINGDILIGDPDSVELKSFDNPGGFKITSVQVEQVRESIAKSFLLLSGAQRNAERVTAAEIERDIQELEGALGGTFSTLSLEMMKARTDLLILDMQREGKLPPWPKDIVSPVILTGLEALSRERDVGRAVQAGQIVQAFGPEALDVVKTEMILGRAFIGLGFPDAVRTTDEVNTIREQRATREAIQQGVGKSIPVLAKAAAEQEGKKR